MESLPGHRSDKWVISARSGDVCMVGRRSIGIIAILGWWTGLVLTRGVLEVYTRMRIKLVTLLIWQVPSIYEWKSHFMWCWKPNTCSRKARLIIKELLKSAHKSNLNLHCPSSSIWGTRALNHMTGTHVQSHMIALQCRTSSFILMLYSREIWTCEIKLENTVLVD